MGSELSTNDGRDDINSFSKNNDNIFPNNHVNIYLRGNNGVGKSTFTSQYIHDKFLDKHDPNIEETLSKKIKMNGRELELRIIDSYTLEHPLMLNAVYRVADGFIIAFSLTDHESFEDLEKYFQNMCLMKDTKYPKFIVIGTKCDLKDQRQVINQEILDFVNTHNTSYIETSSKENINIDQAVEQITSHVVFGKFKYDRMLYHRKEHNFQNVKNEYIDIKFQFQ